MAAPSRPLRCCLAACVLGAASSEELRGRELGITNDWFYYPYEALEGTQVTRPDEEVNFFAVGDWGAQAYEANFLFTINGGSMHNSCDRRIGDVRCEVKSPEWLREEEAQKKVSEQMRKRAMAHPIKWMVNVGDNFYFEGVPNSGSFIGKSVTKSDKFWHTYEQVYKDDVFHVPWFSILGNHDYGGDCCAKDLFGGCDSPNLFGGKAHVTAQFDYDTDKDWQWPAKKETRWVMPNFYYDHTLDLGAYKVHIVAIDTNYADASKQCLKMGGCSNSGELDIVTQWCPAAKDGGSAQCACFMRRILTQSLDFMEKSLAKAFADDKVAWRFVIAHHPWHFVPKEPGLFDRFMSMLHRYKVQILFTGHVHSMRHDILKFGTHMVMTGASGGYQSDPGQAPEKDPDGSTIWCSGALEYGFAHMKMTMEDIKVTYVNDLGKELRTVQVEAKPSYAYVPGEWSACSDMCGEGTITRELSCWLKLHDGSSEERSLKECEEAHHLEMPSKQESCFAEAESPVAYCSQCPRPGSSQSIKCTACAEGFEIDSEHGDCVNNRATAKLQVHVAVPPASGWRVELDELVQTILKNFTDMPLTSRVYSIVKKETAANLEQIEKLAAWRIRRLVGMAPYHAIATVTATDPAVTPEQLHDAIGDVASSPLLPWTTDSAVGTDILGVEAVEIFCPGVHTFDHDRRKCSNEEDENGGSEDGHGGSGGDNQETEPDNIDNVDPVSPEVGPEDKRGFHHNGESDEGGDGTSGLPWWVWLVGGLVLVGAVVAVVMMNRTGKLQARETLGLPRTAAPEDAIGERDSMQLRDLSERT